MRWQAVTARLPSRLSTTTRKDQLWGYTGAFSLRHTKGLDHRSRGPMRKLSVMVVCLLCGITIASCGGSGGSGGKSSSVPLVVNLRANPSPAWINEPVTFSVSCQSVTPGTTLIYTWSFGDNTPDDVTTGPTDTHTYAASGSTPYSQHTYSV